MMLLACHVSLIKCILTSHDVQMATLKVLRHCPPSSAHYETNRTLHLIAFQASESCRGLFDLLPVLASSFLSDSPPYHLDDVSNLHSRQHVHKLSWVPTEAWEARQTQESSGHNSIVGMLAA